MLSSRLGTELYGHRRHVIARMLQRYCHIDVQTKRNAIQALSNRPQTAVSNEADVARHVTKQADGVTVLTQVGLKRMVGPCGLEPQTSTVSRWRSSQLSYGPTDVQSF